MFAMTMRLWDVIIDDLHLLLGTSETMGLLLAVMMITDAHLQWQRETDILRLTEHAMIIDQVLYLQRILLMSAMTGKRSVIPLTDLPLRVDLALLLAIVRIMTDP